MRKTDVFWREKIRELVGNNPRMGDTAIFKELQRIGGARGRNDWPYPRTIRRIREEFQARPDAERRQYQLFFWPGSMGTEDMPWEASTVALELLRHYQKNGTGRPLLRVVKWYWRVTQASPGMARPDRLEAAHNLAVAEILGGLSQREAENVERTLAEAGRYEPVEGCLMPTDTDRFTEVMLAMGVTPGVLQEEGQS